MPFLNLDDNFADHPKIDGLTDGAFRLHVSGMLYVAKHTTDGHIPVARVERLMRRSSSTIGPLRRCAMSERKTESDQTSEGGHAERDPSRGDIAPEREAATAPPSELHTTALEALQYAERVARGRHEYPLAGVFRVAAMNVWAFGPPEENEDTEHAEYATAILRLAEQFLSTSPTPTADPEADDA